MVEHQLSVWQLPLQKLLQSVDLQIILLLLQLHLQQISVQWVLLPISQEQVLGHGVVSVQMEVLMLFVKHPLTEM